MLTLKVPSRQVVMLTLTLCSVYQWMECNAQRTSTARTSTSRNVTTSHRTTSSPSTREPRGPHSFSYIVSIVSQVSEEEEDVLEHQFGGILVTPEVTVSTCVSFITLGVGNTTMVVAGTSRIGYGMSRHTQVRMVQSVTFHTGCYSPYSDFHEPVDTPEHNTAFARLEEPFIYNEHVQPMKLVDNDDLLLRLEIDNMTKNSTTCYKTMFIFVNVSGWNNNTALEDFHDPMTRSLLANVTSWSSTVILGRYPVRLILPQRCRRSFCMLSPVGCRHDFLLHQQICSYPKKIYRNIPRNKADSCPLVCADYVFGLFEFSLSNFSCSPNVHTHAGSILSLLQENGVELEEGSVRKFYSLASSSEQPIKWMVALMFSVPHFMNPIGELYIFQIKLK